MSATAVKSGTEVRRVGADGRERKGRRGNRGMENVSTGKDIAGFRDGLKRLGAAVQGRVDADGFGFANAAGGLVRSHAPRQHDSHVCDHVALIGILARACV